MDERFEPAVEAIRTGDVEGLERTLERDPELATARSSQSHPTLLQCLVLEGKDLPAATQTAMAALLIDAGAPLDEPLVAAGSGSNRVLAEVLLDRGAKLDGDPELLRGWTVLEEALYWGFPKLVDLLLARGARVGNLRIAAGLGRVAEMQRFFDAEGRLDVAAAGAVNWPFGKLPPEQASSDPQDVLDHALVYAAMGDHLDAMRFLLERGARTDAIPRGFHYEGSALHWAALRDRRAACELLLEHGADPALRDRSVEKTPAQWADFDGHAKLAEWLETRARAL